MRLSAIAAILILAATSAFSAPIAVFTPGKSEGIELISTVEDGQWETRIIAGREAVALKPNTTPASRYLYFRLSPDARTKLGSEAYVAVDFLNRGVGRFDVQFNGAENPYTGGRGFLLLGNEEWDRGLVRLSGAKFQGAQNGGADFRLAGVGSLAVSRLEVYAEDPKLNLPSDQERIMKNIKRIPRPKDMFYTFGCEIDQESAALYAAMGVTSIESYVTWENCERAGEGQWDWSAWDATVKALRDNGLKWVPFIILSPAYSTPNWFRAGKEHFPCRCLEHGTDSKIESLWNPNLPKWIDRFIKEFAKRYRDSGVIESVLLGIQGDFGEAIYSVWGGGWTFNVPGEYHNHAGYWCDDPYALADFREFVEKRYKTVAAVNKAWGSEFKSLATVDFPGRKDELTAFQQKVQSGDPGARRRWIDFIDWYRAAMTDWSDWWMATTRKHFPKTPIYLCTGGDAEPHHGSNFAEQTRVSAKHDAGVRITNEASDYAANFAITRWVASAGKHYGAYYGFEPAGAEDEKGIVARIYNATASGANQLHDYASNVTQSQERMNAQREHLKYLFHVKEPIVPVALWYPNVSLTLKWGGYIEKAAQLRDYTDFDYIDETMLRTGALDRHKLLIIIQGEVMEPSDAKKIAAWVKKGGYVLVMDVPKFESVEGTDEPEKILFGDASVHRKLGKGEIARGTGWEFLADVIGQSVRELGIPFCEPRKDGVFATQIGPDRWLFLNTTDKESKVEFILPNGKCSASVKPGTITEVDLSKSTEIVVIGTIHGEHNTAKHYSGEAVKRILVGLKPDAICMELCSKHFESDGTIKRSVAEDSNFPETGAVDKTSRELGIKVFPFDRDDRDENFQKTDYFGRQNRSNQQSNHWMSALSDTDAQSAELYTAKALRNVGNAQRNLTAMATPEVINSDAFDSVIRVKHSLWHDVLPSMMDKYPELKQAADDWRFSRDEWNERNGTMAENIMKIVAKYPGKRIAVVTGCEHRYILRDLLSEKPGVILKEFWQVKPLSD